MPLLNDLIAELQEADEKGIPKDAPYITEK
jgi:hypothetical protein